MTVILVSIGIVAIILFAIASIKLNAYSERTYGYEPINIGTIAFGVIPFVLIFAGQAGAHNGEAGSLELGIFFALISVGVLIWWIAKKTSIEVAIGASFIIIIISLVLLLIILGLADNRKCHSCGHSNCDCYD